ncbi:hypothetical protein JKY79_01495, partial [Candidatus Babeliales bacterium]|nr:hypothetical protein [Candidatus Babeliales bacterium]
MHKIRLLTFFIFMCSLQGLLIAAELAPDNISSIARSSSRNRGRFSTSARSNINKAGRRVRKVLQPQKKRLSGRKTVGEAIEIKIDAVAEEEARKQREILNEVKSTEFFDKVIKKEEKQQVIKAKKEGRIKKVLRKGKKKVLNKIKKSSNKIKNVVTTLQEEAISLDFEKIKLSSFINYIAGLRKLNLIPDKATEAVEISVAIREPLTLDGAWQVFLTMLEMHGFSIIEVGPEGNKANVHKIIPRAGKNIEPLPSYIGTPLDQLPDSDITIRHIAFLQNIAVAEVANLLASMLGPDSRLIAQSNINGFIITDKSLNIKAGMKVIQELDQSGLQETVVVRRLQKANALEVKFLMERLINSPETSPLARLLGKKTEGSVEYFSSSTKIIAEERSNSLILLGNHKS